MSAQYSESSRHRATSLPTPFDYFSTILEEPNLSFKTRLWFYDRIMDSTILAETYASTLGDAEVRQRWLDDQMERHRIEEEEAAKTKVEFYLSNARDAQAYVQILKKVMGEKRLTAKGRVVVLENVRSWATTYEEIVESGLLEDSDRWEKFFILPLKATGGTRFTGRELLDSAGEALCLLGEDDIYMREGN